MLEIHMKLCMAEPEPDILWGWLGEGGEGALPNKLKKWTQNEPQTVFFFFEFIGIFFLDFFFWFCNLLKNNFWLDCHHTLYV